MRFLEKKITEYNYQRESQKAHKGLLDSLERLRFSKNDSEKLTDTLSKMIEHAHNFFKQEESLMIKFHYPDIKKHKAQHTDFLLRTSNFCMDILEMRSDPTNAVIQFLDDWLRQHFIVEHERLSSFLSSSPTLKPAKKKGTNYKFYGVHYNN